MIVNDVEDIVTDSENILDDVCEALSLTCTVRGYVPTAGGVPPSTPFGAVRVSQEGRVPDHVYGGVPPDAMSVVVYGWPAMAAGREQMLMAGVLLA